MRQWAMIGIVGLTIALFASLGASHAWAFRFTSPAEGTQVEAGSTVTVRVDPEGVGVLIGVMFVANGGTMETNMGTDFVVLPPYTWSFTISKNYVGSVNVTAAGKVLGQKTGTAPMAELNLVAVVPSTIILKSLRVRDDQRTLFMRPSWAEKLYVYGQFSDGIERQVSSSTLGTTYQSADATIAMVDPEGMIAAKSVGKTTITVKNGSAQLKVEVNVLPPKVKPGVSP